MSNTAANVSVGKPAVEGAIFRAPLGTTLPTDATTALANAYKGMGYVSEDGVTQSMTRETTEINAWGGDTVRNPLKKKTEKFKFTLIESQNIDVLKAVYGDGNVSGTLAAGLTLLSDSDELDHAVWVIDRKTSDGGNSRTIIPDGQVTEVGDIVYKDDQAIGYEVTITAYPSALISGATSKEIRKTTVASGNS